MNSRNLVNLLLLIAILALGSFVYLKNNNTTQRLTSLDPQTINSIIIPREKGDIILKKVNNSWQMQSPYQLRAHEFRIQRLLDMTQQLPEKFYAINELDLGQFGLENDYTSIRFNDTEISFGISNPINNKRYVKVKDSLYLIDDQLYPLIRSQPSSFVDLRLFTDEQIINKIILPELSITQDEKGSWQTNAADISADQLQNLVEQWQLAQAFGVHAYMPRKQLGNIEIHLQDGNILRLVLSDTDPWLILGNPDTGVEYHFDNSYNQKLLLAPEPQQHTELDNNA